MLKFLAVIGVLAGCGGDDAGPHDLVECGEWPSYGNQPEIFKCERACQEEPANWYAPGMDMPCVGGNPWPQGKQGCARTFEYEGARGCCIDVEAVVIRFFACE
jgi:hypothetical protein